MSAASRRRGAQAHRRAGQAPKSDRRKLVVFAALAALVAVAALVLVGNVLRGDNSAPVEARTAPASGFILGDPNAPVTITAWEDFQCPICKAANSSVVKQIEQDYVDTGKVKIQYKQFPFLGQESVLAAQASQAAADQDKFWPFHDAVFAAQKAENSGALSKGNLQKIAESVGLDMTAFSASLDGGQHAASVQAEKAEGEALGVNATPTFFVNGKQVSDWRDYNAFKALIDQQLAAAGQS